MTDLLRDFMRARQIERDLDHLAQDRDQRQTQLLNAIPADVRAWMFQHRMTEEQQAEVGKMLFPLYTSTIPEGWATMMLIRSIVGLMGMSYRLGLQANLNQAFEEADARAGTKRDLRDQEGGRS